LHAFLYDAVVLDYLSGQDDECKLRVVGNWHAMTGYGIGFPKQSKFKDMINKEIIEMHHSGEIERLRRFWFTGIKDFYLTKKTILPFFLLILGACKSSIDQQSQRSSQQLDVRFSFTFDCLCIFNFSKEILHPLFYFSLVEHLLLRFYLSVKRHMQGLLLDQNELLMQITIK
jgi:hypothetical protein